MRVRHSLTYLVTRNGRKMDQTPNLAILPLRVTTYFLPTQ